MVILVWPSFEVLVVHSSSQKFLASKFNEPRKVAYPLVQKHNYSWCIIGVMNQVPTEERPNIEYRKSQLT